MHRNFGFIVLSASICALPTVGWGQDVLENRLGDLEDRMDAVEKKTILDRINITGEYRAILNSYIYEQGDTKRTTDEIWTNRLRLTFRGEPSRSVRVTARLTMYKIFGDADQQAFIPDFEQSRVPRDTVARFDQVWIDWFVTEWLAISAGRIAYAGGPPEDLYNNSPTRQGTWASALVDGEYDTVNLTLNLSSILPELYIRTFYGSFFIDDDNGIPFLSKPDVQNTRAMGGNIEFPIPGLGRNFVQVGYLTIPRWTLFPSGIPDPTANQEADFNNAPPPLGNTIIFPSNYPEHLGMFQNVFACLIFYDLLGSGLDIFALGSVGFNTSSNQGVEYEIKENPADPNSNRRSTPLLFLAGTGDGKTVQTSLFYAGLRYQLPFEALNNPKVGIEFNTASRYFISLQQTTDRLLSKLETRGKAVESYAIFPVNEFLFLRAGYLYIDRDYDGVFVGLNPAIAGSTAPRLDEIIHNFHLTLQANL